MREAYYESGGAAIYCGDCRAVMAEMPAASVQCCVRDANGRFVKGHRYNPATEFKKGQHWRPAQPFRNREWLVREYVEKKRTAAEIAAAFGVTANAIHYWMHKHGIRGRSMSEIRAARHWALTGAANGMHGRRGAKNPAWRGGITPERQAFYQSADWKAACRAVWRRDDATCQDCGIRKTKGQTQQFHIHHIVSFAVVALRADVSNLILLCADCHHRRHRKGSTA